MCWYALSLPSVLMRLCPRDDTTLFSVVIRPCPRDDKPLFSGGRVKGFPKSQEKLCRVAVKMVGVILKRNDTDVGRWRWVEKGVSRFCHTPSALRARPPVSRGQSGWPVSFIAAAVEIDHPFYSSSSMFIMRSISSRSWAARVKSSFFAASCMRWRVVSMAFFSCLGDMLSMIGSATFMLGTSTST